MDKIAVIIDTFVICHDTRQVFGFAPTEFSIERESLYAYTAKSNAQVTLHKDYISSDIVSYQLYITISIDKSSIMLRNENMQIRITATHISRMTNFLSTFLLLSFSIFMSVSISLCFQTKSLAEVIIWYSLSTTV